MRRISKKLFLAFLAFFVLFGHVAQACRGLNAERTIFFEKRAQENYQRLKGVVAVADVVVESIIETTGPSVWAYANVLDVLKGDSSLKGQKVIVRFNQNSCGPYLKEGDSGIVYAYTVAPHPFSSRHEDVIVLGVLTHQKSDSSGTAPKNL